MARPKKAVSDRTTRREVYATPAEWAEIDAAAVAAELTMSRYLVSAGLQAQSRRLTRQSARQARYTVKLGRVQACLEQLAAAVETDEADASPVLILARLGRMEAMLSDLAEDARL